MLFVAISAVNRGAKYCDQRVCLSVRSALAYLRNHMSILSVHF